MKAFLAWLLASPRALQQANNEIAWLRSENKRLNDILTQAFESARIIPRQPEHREPVPAAPERRKSIGEMQMEFQDQAAMNYAAWQREEAARLEQQRQSNGNKPS